MSWHELGAVLPGRLHDARLMLHWAAQLVSAPGNTLLPAESDYSHTNLVWDPALGVLAGRPAGESSLRAALIFESLDLAVLDGTVERASLSLSGSTMKKALEWLGGQVAKGGPPLALPDHDMPSHPVGDGAPFSDADGDGRTELASWFANASSLVNDAVASERNASPVRCWPHHFDVASLITLDDGKEAESARSIGVGFSPGDGSHDQPYLYVTPWPYPDADALPELGAGARWHTEGFTAAVLLGDQIISSSPRRRAAQAQEMLGEAIGACRSVLGA